MRIVYFILFVLLLAVPFVMQRLLVVRPATTSTETSAADRLVIITPHNTEIRAEYARAFKAWHRDTYHSDVELDFRVPGGTSDVKRQLDTTYRAAKESGGPLPDDISIAWGGGDYFMDQELKPLGILQPIHMPPALKAEFIAAFPQPTLAGVRLYEGTTSPDGTPTPQWIGVCLSSFGICYNPDVYHGLAIPDPRPEHGWSDLTDPRLAGFLALADPAHSGSSAVAYQIVIQHKMAQAESALFTRRPALKKLAKNELGKNAEYRQAIAAGWKQGMAELVKIAANARYFTDSSPLVPMDVSRGEAAAGMGIDFYARVTEESVGPGRMQYIAPIGATAITPDPVAILKGASGRKLELSEHFVQFLLSPQGQRLWILKPHTPGGPAERSLRRMPIRQDIYADQTNWADHGDPIKIANGFNQRGEWMALFSDSRPIWVAAWIDSRDALLDAYAAIRKVPDPSRRAALLDDLANLPIEMSDVEAIRTKRKELEQSHGEVDVWRAKQQMNWAREFRTHYRDVAAMAH